MVKRIVLVRMRPLFRKLLDWRVLSVLQETGRSAECSRGLPFVEVQRVQGLNAAQEKSCAL